MSAADDLVEALMQEGARQRRNAAKLRAARPKAAPGEKIKRGHPERDAQQAVVAWLRAVGCLVNASENERRADSADPNAQARFQMMRKKNGITPGWPDLTVALPGGRIVLIEMKARGGRLSPAQQDVHAMLEALGAIVVVGTSLETVQAALAARGVRIPLAGRMGAAA